SLGFKKVCHPSKGHASEDILALPALSQAQGLSVLILAAEGGRQIMDQQLAERGARVSRLHVYRRRPAPPPADLEEKLLCSSSAITLLASGGALSALESSLSAAAWSHLASGLMIAPSLRVATLARAAGVDQVEVADGADNRAMLSALAEAQRSGRLRYS
ncbi:MAG TPA: uroporphyrinogen-III synthase, partial [Wenzhouxiangella sp.]|nr:uroporphyrinogen-III synthase [Wenzhouxiangella sp.]